MDIDSSIGIKQPQTINLSDGSTELYEDLSEVWTAAEALSSPNLEARKAGFDRLVNLRAYYRFPLVVYLLATRLNDPDLKFRSHITRVIGEILSIQNREDHVMEAARIRLADYISQMRSRQIFGLLQVADSGLCDEETIARILSYNSYAGDHLSGILADWQAPINIRKKSVVYIERVGYVDAIPVLERVASRLRSRYSDKQMSLWDIADGTGEASLLPVVERALRVLHAP